MRSMQSIWFGNFFEPFYSNAEAVRRGIAECAALGFTTINLDSKPWEDFFARYRGEPASQYLAIHELIMSEAASHGMDYNHLALYLCGDNLYPSIRDVPPVRGEESIRPDGRPMGTYKYWSPVAQQTMVDHVRGLLSRYRDGMHRRISPDGRPRIVMQTMFDPIIKPSFDTEGRHRYLAWLEKHYAGDIALLNRRYALTSPAKSFEDFSHNASPETYWLRPEILDWVDCAIPTADDFARRTPDFHRWIDNQTWLASETEIFFATMQKHWRELEPSLLSEPVLHQWGYFFNPPGRPHWPTAKRALDVYRIAPHVDSAFYITSPLNAENRPDAMAISVEGSILRNANAGRPFTGGLFLGRHINADIYREVPPAEAMATLVAAGVTSMHSYGYSGLDDGGVLYRMDDVFKNSLREGNRWAAEVMPRLAGTQRAREIALLFPAEMSLYEPLELDPEGRHRMDLLGWYCQLTDLGWHVDIVHPDQVAAGVLSAAAYRALVIPHNSLYDLSDHPALESAVKDYVSKGGILVHGPHCALAKNAFGIVEAPVAFDCIQWQEPIIPHGWSTVAWLTAANRRALAHYIQSGETAIADTAFGQGHVYSFGFQYGHSYSRRTMPFVPPNYGRREMHPIVLMRDKTPLAELLGTSPLAEMPPQKGVEFARFSADSGNKTKLIVVNHRASPIDISGIMAKGTSALTSAPSAPGYLAAHSALYIEL